jgi:CheY-like chemotaxis protein
VRIVHDGQLAVSEAAAFGPDLALVDLGLPGLDGYEVARMIRSRPELAHTALVAVSGWGQEEHRKRSAAAGFSRHLVKPVTPETLREVLAGVPRKVENRE